MKISTPFLRSAYNYDRDAASDEAGLKCEDVSRTKQSFADEADINTIVRNFGLTGSLPDNYNPPQYGDFEGIADYQSALNAVIAADDAFMQMPPNLRERFHNNPQNLIEFLASENNYEEAVSLGLVQARSGEQKLDPNPKDSGQQASPKGAAGEP